MGVATTTRVWATHRSIFDKIPVRGCFTFQNGNPSGVFVKVSPTLCAQPAQEHLDNPHFAFRTVLKRGSGSLNFAGSGSSDFAFWQGNTVNVSRSAKVFEVNPSNVITEANMRDW
jgi:hypothetical protein